MTPIEKAKEIVDKYLNVEIMFYDADTVGEYIDIMRTEEAKQCALIAVDEILNITWVDSFLTVEEYWQQVKHEIEKL